MQSVLDEDVCCFFMEADSILFFLLIKTRQGFSVHFFSTVTVTIVCFFTSVVITGVRGAHAGILHGCEALLVQKFLIHILRAKVSAQSPKGIGWHNQEVQSRPDEK